MGGELGFRLPWGGTEVGLLVTSRGLTHPMGAPFTPGEEFSSAAHKSQAHADGPSHTRGGLVCFSASAGSRDTEVRVHAPPHTQKGCDSDSMADGALKGCSRL